MIRSVLLTSSSVALALLLVLAVPLSASAAELPALPDPIMTPGAINPAAMLGVICNGTTRERRHVTAAEKAEVLELEQDEGGCIRGSRRRVSSLHRSH